MDRKKAGRELWIFCGMTLGLSFLVFWGPLALFKVPAVSFVDDTMGPVWAIILYIIGGFVPSLAGIILTAVFEGGRGVKRLFRRVIRIKIGIRNTFLIILLPLLLGAVQIILYSLLVGTFEFSLFLAQAGSLIPLIFLGPISEELGWRGFAQSRALSVFSSTKASLIIVSAP